MAVLPSVHTTDDDYETLEMMVSPDNDTRPHLSPDLAAPRTATHQNRHSATRCDARDPGGAHPWQRIGSDPHLSLPPSVVK